MTPFIAILCETGEPTLYYDHCTREIKTQGLHPPTHTHTHSLFQKEHTPHLNGFVKYSGEIIKLGRTSSPLPNPVW